MGQMMPDACRMTLGLEGFSPLFETTIEIGKKQMQLVFSISASMSKGREDRHVKGNN